MIDETCRLICKLCVSAGPPLLRLLLSSSLCHSMCVRVVVCDSVGSSPYGGSNRIH